MGGLRLNTLFSTTFSFSSISLPSAVYISSFSILSFSIFSFNVCWSFLACLGVINFNFISCPSCLKQRERSSSLSALKWSHTHLKRRWQEFVGAISHNTSFTHCPVLNFLFAWFEWKLVGNWCFSTNLSLTRLLPLSSTNATKHGWPSMKHLIFVLRFPSSLSFLTFRFLQFPFLLVFTFVLFLFFLFLFSPSAYVDPYWLFLVS